MSGRVEYNKWKPYLQLLTNPKTPVKVKKSILENCPKEVIYAIEEILINVQVREKKIYKNVLKNQS